MIIDPDIDRNTQCLHVRASLLIPGAEDIEGGDMLTAIMSSGWNISARDTDHPVSKLER